FGWGEELIQIIDAEAAVDWRFVDLSAESPAQRESSIRRLRVADREEPYGLGSGSLFRVYLVSHGPADYLCLFSHHHSILDGWSNTVLLNRVHEIYEAIVSGLPTDSVPDRSYPAGQQYLQEHRDDHSEFWRDALAVHDEGIDLQGLLSAEARANGLRVEATRRVEEMRELDVTLSGAQYDALRRAARETGVTLNALFLYVWNKTLACYTGTDQTITGVVLSGRGIPVNDIDKSVGLFINTLPLIVDHGADHETVLDGLRSVQEQINELNARATVNLGELHEGADRLFDTLFIYENWPKINADGWQERLAVHMEGESEKLDYPLSVIVSETPDAIRLRLVYAAELFDERLMSGMLDLQRHLLTEVAADRERRWRDTVLLSADQFLELDAALNPPT
ncbi:condensation domain-containing protein, partial [Streptomyces sp. NPDC000931]|uniref:condensation domain-containing protein n=1 Tax=Streptomyces sp. NPDC000931 TaxID=3154372 RepID=UPI0033274A1D